LSKNKILDLKITINKLEKYCSYSEKCKSDIIKKLCQWKIFHNHDEIINHLITNIENISADSLTLYIDQTQSYVTLMPQFSDYEALKSTGKLYKISDFDLLQKIIDLYDNKYGEIDRLMVEDKRAIFMQDEFFIKNYAMQPAKVWTTLKDAKTDLLRIKSDKVYMNYLVFMYKVKMQVNERWTKLIDEIKIVKNEIDLKKQNRAN